MIEAIKRFAKRHYRFIEYAIAGLFNTLVDFAAFTVCREFIKLPVECCQLVGFICGSVNGYLLNSNFAFREGKGRTRAQFAQYVFTDALLALFSSQAMGIAEESGLPVYVFKIIMVVFITLVHYVVFKRVIFKIKKEDTER